jgi:hypothetical protein
MGNAFGAESTADDVLQGIDLSGKKVLATGVSAVSELRRRDLSSLMVPQSSVRPVISTRRGGL